MLVLSNDLVLSKSILIFNGTHFTFCTRFPGTFFQKLENISRCWSKVVYIIGIVFQKSYCRFERMDLCSKKSHNLEFHPKWRKIPGSLPISNPVTILRILNWKYKTKVDDFFRFLKIQNFLKLSENVN